MQVVRALKLRVQFSDTRSATYNLHTNIRQFSSEIALEFPVNKPGEEELWPSPHGFKALKLVENFK